MKSTDTLSPECHDLADFTRHKNVVLEKLHELERAVTFYGRSGLIHQGHVGTMEKLAAKLVDACMIMDIPQDEGEAG